MIPLDDLNFKEKLKNIKAFVFDVDGVLSGSVVHICNDGELERTTNVKDGYAIKKALEADFAVGIITGGKSQAVKERFENLGVDSFYLASENKIEDFNDFLKKKKLKASSVLYMGDDIPDMEVMKQCGVATCPADADEQIKAISLYISQKEGGKACVRDIIVQVMRTQNKWFVK